MRWTSPERRELSLSRYETSDEGIIYEHELPVVIINSSRDRDERPTLLTARVKVMPDSSKNVSRLSVELVDNLDHLFLYLLHMTEPEFHKLKQCQDLKVDFPAFAPDFIKLLTECAGCLNQSSPKFVAKLSLEQTQQMATFAIFETNRFKNLQHLQLEFMAASDSELKQHLSLNLRHFKACSMALQKEVHQLKQLNKEKEAKITTSRRDFESQIQDSERQKTNTQAEFYEQISQIKEGAMSVQRKLENQLEDERRQLISDHNSETTQMMSKLHAALEEKREISEVNLNLEHSLKTLQARHDATATDLDTALAEQKKLKISKELIDSQTLNQEKEINMLSSKLQFFEQQLKDKDALCVKVQSLLEACNEQKARLEESMTVYKESAQKDAQKVDCRENVYKKEIEKGNQIIQDLESRLKKAKSKLKQKGWIIAQQETVLHKANDDIESLNRQVLDLDREAKAKQTEEEKREQELSQLRKDLKSREAELESNQKVFNMWSQERNELPFKGARPLHTLTAKYAVPSRPSIGAPGTSRYESSLTEPQSSMVSPHLKSPSTTLDYLPSSSYTNTTRSVPSTSASSFFPTRTPP